MEEKMKFLLPFKSFKGPTTNGMAVAMACDAVNTISM